MSENKTKILLVEDDTNLGFLLLEFLESNGFDVKLYRDGESGLNGFIKSKFDFCILDVMLPKLDGFSLAEKIRENDRKIPIIFLTARSMKEDKIRGFKIGIDDYITKPFDEDELLLRIESILYRVNDTEVTDKEVYTIGKFTFDVNNQELKSEIESKRLTSKECKILSILAKNLNNIVSRDELMNEVWGQTDYFIGRSLDVFISKIRRHLKFDSSIKIETIPTVGIILSTSA